MLKGLTALVLICSFSFVAHSQENMVPELIRAETIVAGEISDVGMRALLPAHGTFTTAGGATLRYDCSPGIGRNAIEVAFREGSLLGEEHVDAYGRSTDSFKMAMAYSVCTAQLHQIDAVLKSGNQVLMAVKGFEANHLSIQFSEVAAAK